MAPGNTIGWQRVIVVTAIGTAAVLISDRIGLVNYLAEKINGTRPRF